MTKSYAPRMHSAEHILNQAMVRKFDCGRCFSAHVNKKKSKCDYHFDRSLTDDEANEVEAEVNQVISANLDVTEEIVSLEEAARNFNITRLPEGVEIVRIVNVDNTTEIGEFRMISHDFNDRVLRIRYKLGDLE